MSTSESAPGPTRCGFDDVIAMYKRDIDRSLLRESLSRSPDERVRQLIELLRFIDEAHRAGRKLRAT